MAPTDTVPAERLALIHTLGNARPNDSTACTQWRVHEVVAHLAAGAKEHADLIEHRLDGRGERVTRDFEERELPFRALDHDTLMDALTSETERKQLAYTRLAASDNPTIAFTGTRVTKDRADMHSRSEAALHRWDITGDDDTSMTLLAQPELAAHAAWVLDNMPILNESAQSLATRASLPHSTIAFRTPDQADIVLTVTPQRSRFEIVDEAVYPDLVLTTRADHRPLLLWGRRPAALDLTVEGDRDLLPDLQHALWADANPWRTTT